MKQIANPLLKSWVMPTLLVLGLTVAATACGDDDDLAREQPATQQPHTVAVSLDASIAGDGATRASYGYGGSKKVDFETGDQLLVVLSTDSWTYTGTLSNSSATATFTGTLTKRSGSDYSGTDIIKDAKKMEAWLLPKDYSSQYISLTDSDPYIKFDAKDAFVAGSFSSGVAQVCRDKFSVDDAAGVAKSVMLTAQNAVVCLTITGLAPSTEYNTNFTDGTLIIGGKVTADSGGKATFSVGYQPSGSEKDYTVFIDGCQDINLGAKTLKANKVYQVSRAATADTSYPAGTVIDPTGEPAVIVKLVIDSQVKKVAIRKRNVGATADCGADSYGTYYTWEEARGITATDGWYVPDKAEFEALMKLPGGEWDDEKKCWKWTFGTEAIYLPAAGYKTGDGKYYADTQGVKGLYWAKSGSSGYPDHLYFHSTSFEASSSGMSATDKCPVRLFKTITE